MKKILYMIIVSMLTMGCVSHYGAFGNGSRQKGSLYIEK